MDAVFLSGTSGAIGPWSHERTGISELRAASARRTGQKAGSCAKRSNIGAKPSVWIRPLHQFPLSSTQLGCAWRPMIGALWRSADRSLQWPIGARETLVGPGSMFQMTPNPPPGPIPGCLQTRYPPRPCGPARKARWFVAVWPKPAPPSPPGRDPETIRMTLLTDKVAIVTGASSGIGRAIAQALRQRARGWRWPTLPKKPSRAARPQPPHRRGGRHGLLPPHRRIGLDRCRRTGGRNRCAVRPARRHGQQCRDLFGDGAARHHARSNGRRFWASISRACSSAASGPCSR